MVFYGESGEAKDLTFEEVREMIKGNDKLETYITNPDLIPHEEMEQELSGNWQKLAGKVLMACWKQKGAFWFHEPVDPVRYNIMDYNDIVREPMDLGTIKKKLSHNVYANATEFVKDMRLVFANCYRYNGEVHDISVCAKEVEMVFEDTLKSTGLSKDIVT